MLKDSDSIDFEDWNDFHLQVTLFFDNLRYLVKSAYLTEQYESAIIAIDYFLRFISEPVEDFQAQIRKKEKSIKNDTNSERVDNINDNENQNPENPESKAAM